MSKNACVGSLTLPERATGLRGGVWCGCSSVELAEVGDGLDGDCDLDGGAATSGAMPSTGGEPNSGLGGGEFSSDGGGTLSRPDSTSGDDGRESPSFAASPLAIAGAPSIPSVEDGTTAGHGTSVEGRVTTGGTGGLGSAATTDLSHGRALTLSSDDWRSVVGKPLRCPSRLLRVSSSRLTSGTVAAGREARGRPATARLGQLGWIEQHSVNAPGAPNEDVGTSGVSSELEIWAWKRLMRELALDALDSSAQAGSDRTGPRREQGSTDLEAACVMQRNGVSSAIVCACPAMGGPSSGGASLGETAAAHTSECCDSAGVPHVHPTRPNARSWCQGALARGSPRPSTAPLRVPLVARTTPPDAPNPASLARVRANVANRPVELRGSSAEQLREAVRPLTWFVCGAWVVAVRRVYTAGSSRARGPGPGERRRSEYRTLVCRKAPSRTLLTKAARAAAEGHRARAKGV